MAAVASLRNEGHPVRHFYETNVLQPLHKELCSKNLYRHKQQHR